MSNVRRVLVVIRGGWIIAGNMTEDAENMYLTKAVSVCKWTGGQWLTGVIQNWKKDVTLSWFDENAKITIPKISLLYCVDVVENWGTIKKEDKETGV